MVTALLCGSCTQTNPAEHSGRAPLPEVADASTNATVTPPVLSDEGWTGTYVSEVGSFYVFDAGEWAGVTWRGADAGSGLGRGELTLTVERATRRVSGTANGAIGDVVLLGTIDNGTLAASVLRKSPLDGGLAGTAIGEVSRDQIVGTMRLSSGDARLIREARFTVARRSP